jgi:hypothetical protein
VHARPQMPPFVKPPAKPVQAQEPAAPPPAAGRTTPVSADTRARVPVAPLIEPSIMRLEEVIDQETEALRSRKSVDLKGFNERKGQALLELTRLLRHVQGGAGNPQLQARMASVRAKLEVNRALLKMHLEAVREIAETLSDAIRNAESDGTYSHTVLANSRRQ